MSCIQSFALACALLSLTSGVAHARLPMHYEDAIVVERAELIVVAHLKEGSIQFVSHVKKSMEPVGWDHHARLVITQVLKGECTEKEIPVIIHHDLLPIVGGVVQREGGPMMNLRGADANYPKDMVEIVEYGTFDGFRRERLDARDDHLWFLRKRRGVHEQEPVEKDYGIYSVLPRAVTKP